MNLAKAKECYEVLTTNPFWKNYDMQYFERVRKQLYDLQQELCRVYPWNSELRKKNPAAVLFGSMSHDFNLMMNQLYWSTVEEDVQENYKMSENKKFVLNTWIRILRHLTYKQEYKENIGWLIDYSPYFKIWDNKHDRLAKFTTVQNEDGTYRAVRVVTEEQRIALLSWFKEQYEKYKKCHATGHLLDWYQSEIDLLESGAKLTECFKFD